MFSLALTVFKYDTKIGTAVSVAKNTSMTVGYLLSGNRRRLITFKTMYKEENFRAFPREGLLPIIGLETQIQEAPKWQCKNTTKK